MNLRKKTVISVMLVTALTLCFEKSILAQDEWKFGIGTGFGSNGLEGDLGFATSGGGVIADVDLDASGVVDILDLLIVLSLWGPCR